MLPKSNISQDGFAQSDIAGTIVSKGSARVSSHAAQRSGATFNKPRPPALAASPDQDIHNTSQRIQCPTVVGGVGPRDYTQVKFSAPPPFYKKLSSKNTRIYGMSLIEVILAIAVAGFVLVSAVSLLVSVSSIWSERSERHFFIDHVDGVTEFLNATFATSGTEIVVDRREDNIDENTENPNGDPASIENESGLTNSADESIRWKRPPGFANYQEPLLNFNISEEAPILVGLENAPTLGINAFLHFEAGEGLSLLWHSILQEEVEDLNDLRRTLISPLVTKITYIYWDERFEAWEEEDRPQKDDGADQYNLPRFVKLIFEYEGETKERILTIPVPIRSALIF